MTAFAVACAFAAYPPLQDFRLQPVALGLGGLALLLLAGGLVTGWATPLGCGMAVLGAQYAVLLFSQEGGLDELTPLYAAGLMLIAELAYWSIEPRAPSWTEYGLLLRRLAYVIGACAGAAAVSGLVLVAAASTRGGGVALEALGAAAAVGAFGLVVWLSRAEVR